MNRNNQKLDKYSTLTTDKLEEISGGFSFNWGSLLDPEIINKGRDFLWGFKNGFEGRSREHGSWRNRD